MTSWNYYFLADSEYQWARYHIQEGDFTRFWPRYQQSWRYLWLMLKAFTRETYDTLRKRG